MALAAGLVVAPPGAGAGEREDLEVLRATTMSLVEALVQQGVLTREKADALLAQARAAGERAAAQAASAEGTAAPAAQAAAQPAVPMPEGAAAKTVRVPYVPEFVRREITEQVRKDVMAQAKSEGWAAPSQLPDWLSHITLGGDVRVRHEHDQFRQPCSATVVANCNYDAVTYDALTLDTLNNTTQDRTLNALRARLSVDAKVSERVDAGFRVATGSLTSPVSTKQTLGNSFNRDQFALDRGFLAWHDGDQARLAAGRIPNPFLSTDMLWSENLNFDGAALTMRPHLGPARGFLTVGGFPVQDYEPSLTSSAKNKWLYALQAGADWHANADRGVQLGVALYDFHNVEGVPNPAVAGAVANSNTAPTYTQKGNSLFNVNYLVPVNSSGAAAAVLPGLLSKFRELDYTLVADLGRIGETRVTYTMDYVRNLGWDINEIERRTGLVPLEPGTISLVGATAPSTVLQPKTRGYTVKLGLGQPQVAEPGRWHLDMGYRHLERDAVLDAFNDSDWHTGGTDYRGWFVTGALGLDHGLYLGARWFTGDPISGPPLAIDVLQLDLGVQF